jgi:hypothetical protein
LLPLRIYASGLQVRPLYGHYSSMTGARP